MALSLRSVGRYAGLAVCSLIVAASSIVFAQTANPAPKNFAAPGSLLPARFSGWVEQSAPKSGTTSQAADSANADALSEYGLKSFAEANYQHGTAVAHVRAFSFSDATGAYGAFTFYREPEMRPEAIGGGGARNSHEAVFWSGATMVDVTFGASGAPPISSLKELAAELPHVTGSAGVVPPLPSYLPEGFVPSTVRYAIGPAAYALGGGILPPQAIDFSRDAEAVTAHYATKGGEGVLTLIEYPTPQMSSQAETALNALLKEPHSAVWKGSSPSALAIRRSGPVIAVTSGGFSVQEAQALLSKVKYHAEISWSHPQSGQSEVKKAAEMLVGIAYLTAILIACALIMAAFLGGGRVLWRMVRGKPVSSVYEEDFISLNLSGWNPRAPRKLP